MSHDERNGMLTDDEIESLFNQGIAAIYAADERTAFRVFDRLSRLKDSLDPELLRCAEVARAVYDPKTPRDEAAKGLLENFAPKLIRFEPSPGSR